MTSTCLDDYHDGRWRGTIKIDLLHKLIVYMSILVRHTYQRQNPIQTIFCNKQFLC